MTSCASGRKIIFPNRKWRISDMRFYTEKWDFRTGTDGFSVWRHFPLENRDFQTGSDVFPDRKWCIFTMELLMIEKWDLWIGNYVLSIWRRFPSNNAIFEPANFRFSNFVGRRRGYEAVMSQKHASTIVKSIFAPIKVVASNFIVISSTKNYFFKLLSMKIMNSWLWD